MLTGHDSVDLNADDLQTVCFPERPGGGDERFGRFAPSKITHRRRKLEAERAGAAQRY